MVKRKYEHLVKQLSVGAVDMEAAKKRSSPKGALAQGPGNADKLVWLNGKEHLEGLNLNFTWGFYKGLGDWHTGVDPHTHPYPECLVFVGLDPTNIDYLGAEIEIAMGEELETYTFNTPTCVVIPAGFPHCPLVTKKVTNPKGFAFYLISLGAEPSTTWMGTGASKVTKEQFAIMQESLGARGMKLSMGDKLIDPAKPRSKGKKYAHLIKPLKTGPVHKAKMAAIANSGLKMGPANADQIVWLYGDELEGLNLNFTWGFYSKPGIWHRGGGAHVHPVDEILVFVGLDPTDIDYLGAEFEIDMGKEHESHVFNKPSVVICPAGLPHLPLITRWVDKPYGFFVIGLDKDHDSPFID